METRKVAILGGARIPFCRSGTSYKDASNFDLMSITLKALVDKFGLKGQRLGDVSLGAILKHSADFNLARESVLESGLAPETPAFDIQRACGTSLEAALLIGNKIALGHPFAATGGRLVATLARLLKEKGKGRGLISVCTAGGMGVAAVLERG